MAPVHMSNPSIENVVVIGTGCAGLTAAIYTARASLNPLVLEGPLPGGQLTTTSEVENFPGFPHGVDGFQLTQNMREQATRFGTRFEQAMVDQVDFTSTPRKLFCGDRIILAKTVIIATGASPRLTGIPGEKDLYGGKGVTTCATCDGAFYRKMELPCSAAGIAPRRSVVSDAFRQQGIVHRRDARAPQNHGRSPPREKSRWSGTHSRRGARRARGAVNGSR